MRDFPQIESAIDVVREMCRHLERLYVCEVCSLAYKERVLAEKCEDFCKRHNACSIEITVHAVKKI
jgi:hypothetical protein